MGLFDYFKGKKKADKRKTTRDKYWSLITYKGEIKNPTMEQIKEAVKNANRNASLFATLAYNNSELEIDSIQTMREEGVYRFEALTSDSIIYVKNDIRYEETVEYFVHFFKYQHVANYKSWPTEKYS